MPIVDVEVVAHTLPAGLAGKLADAAGRVFESAPGTTWVRLRALDPACYAENGGAQVADAGPVFVTVQKRAMPAPADLAREISTLTEAIAGAVGCPAHRVHVQYAPAAAGRQAFGGTLVK